MVQWTISSDEHPERKRRAVREPGRIKSALSVHLDPLPSLCASRIARRG